MNIPALQNLFLCFPSCLPPFNDHWQNRNQNNGDDHQLKILFHEFKSTKEITKQGKGQHPRDAADNVIGDEITIRHLADARHERSERAHDGYETRQEDRLAAMLFKEVMCFIKVFFFDPLDVVGALAKIMTDGVINRIAKNGSADHQQNKKANIQRTQSGKCASREQQ